MTTPVLVWWANLGRRRAVRTDLMDEAERERYRAMRRPAAREQFALGCALLRAAAADHLGCAPSEVSVRRSCPDCDQPHGKPQVTGGAGVELSLSHTERWVVCAVMQGTPIGVDVEDGAGLLISDGLPEKILASAEVDVYRTLPADARVAALLTYWARKEAVLKATGDGLRVPMRTVAVSGPHEEPRLLEAASLLRASEITLHDLRGPITPADGEGPLSAALAVIGPPPSRVVELDADALLRLDEAASAVSR